MDDEATILLMLHFSREDLETISSSRKGKVKDDAPPTDEEIAFQLHAQELAATQQTLEDAAFCRSLDNAIDTDQRVLLTLDVQETAANDDRSCAEAMDRGDPVPELSEAQRDVEQTVGDVQAEDRVVLR